MRRSDREVRDPAQIRAILDTCGIVHLGLMDDGVPYIVPMNYGYTMEKGKLTLFLHCAKEGHKLDLIQRNPICCFEMECGIHPFGDSDTNACVYGMAYSSLMGRGRASIVTDPQEKVRALAVLMHTQTRRDFILTEAQASSVSIIRVEADSYTAKHRPLPQNVER